MLKTSTTSPNIIRYRYNGATCPACGEDCNGHAALWPEGKKSIMCLHTSPAEGPEGWWGVSKTGGWTLFWANSDEAQRSWEECVADCGSHENVRQSKGGKKGFVKRGKNYIPQDELDVFTNWATEYLCPTTREWSKAHKDLNRRGLSDHQIAQQGFIDFNVTIAEEYLPPELKSVILKLFGNKVVNRLEKGLVSERLEVPYYLVPVKDFSGRVTGYQKRHFPAYMEKMKERAERREEKFKLGKYLWAGNYAHDGKVWTAAEASTGTLPLQVCRGENESRYLLLTEGTLKPFIVWENLGRKHSVMGAAGGAFTASSGLFLASLLAFKIYHGVEHVVWLADPASYERNEDGTWKRQNVVANIASAKAFCEEHGFNFTVADWGQLEEKDSSLDPDVVSAKVIQDALPKLPKSAKENLNRLVADTISGDSSLKIGYNTPNAGSIATVYAETIDEVLQLYGATDKKYVLNNTSLGSGKSWIVDSIPMEGFDKHVYVSLSPRNPSIDKIESNFFRLEGRHGGLVYTGNRTPNGAPVTRRPKAGEEPHTAGNCAFADAHTTARLNGLDSSKVCMECPFRKECIAGTHEDYDYLYMRIQAEKQEKIRASIATLNPANIDESYILTLDEPTSSASFSESFTITAQEARHFVSEINRIAGKKLLSVDIDMVASFNSVSGVVEAARQVDCDIQEALKRQYYSSKQLNSHYKGARAVCYRWISILLNPHQSWTMKGSVYSCLTRNQHVLDIISAAGKVIFLDATAEPEILAAQYGLNLDDCLVIKNTDKATKNVEVTVLVTNGFNSRKQSIPTKKKIIPEVKELLNAKYGNDNVGYIAHSEYCEPGDIAFFSESRGSNRYQDRKAVCMFGLPQIDLRAAEQQWHLIKESLPLWEFRDYYNHLSHSEIKQAIGRIRGYRRQDESLSVYVVANCRLNRLEYEGYDVSYKVAALVGIKSAYTPQIAAIEDVYRAASSLHQAQQTITHSALAQILGKDRKNVSRTLKRLNVTLSALNDFFSVELQAGKFSPVPQAFSATMDTMQKFEMKSMELFDRIGLDSTLEAMKTIVSGNWPQGMKREQTNLLRNGIAYRMREFLNIPKHLTEDYSYDTILKNLVEAELEESAKKESQEAFEEDLSSSSSSFN